ncbi:hypothetical protein [Streptomyces sp. NPDC002054]|uniref:hypothetical protein n=1 Tax=Streptomyces sp. NPDC002054 TaxID=3154663 RepID=UPI00331B65D7
MPSTPETSVQDSGRSRALARSVVIGRSVHGAAVQARTDPAERRILHGYAVWQHLRRLRRPHLQALNVRCHVTATANFLDWLAGNGLTLSDCTQADLEHWTS